MSYDTKIACPKCEWEPDGGAYWGCSGCGHIWDTFKTTGVCPECQHRHKHTQCIGYAGGCNESSLHVNWYREIDRNLQEEIEKIEKLIPAEII